MRKDGFEFDRMLDNEIAEYTDNVDLFGILSVDEKEEALDEKIKEQEQKYNSLRSSSGLAYLQWLSIWTVLGNIIIFCLIYKLTH